FVCVDPEHLKTKEWREIADFPEFRFQLLYSATDEAHLINEWGRDFRVDFKGIGLFVRGRLPPSISVVGLSATLAPGKDTNAVCQSLGFFDGHFHMIRRTNERPNVQFSMQTLSHGLSGYEFPDLLPYLRSGRKVIVNFHSLPILFSCYAWIWRMQPASADKKRRTRMYHSGCSAEYNEETIRMVLEDPLCQIILCTIAFSNGINARTLLDCITVGFHFTIDILWQQMGRVGRQEDTRARGTLLIQQSTITLAEKYLKAVKSAQGKTGRKLKGSETMTIAKAELITEARCHVAYLNKHYDNPPLEISTLDCIAAKRPLPCGLCLSRTRRTLTFPAPPTAPSYPPLTPVTSARTSARTGSTKAKLTREERVTAYARLAKFRNELRRKEHKRGKFLEHPTIMFLPSSLHNRLLDRLFSISSLSDLQHVVHDWRHRDAQSNALYDLIVVIKMDIASERE
ncbi:hypothetical protein C8R45DRAFT_791971, partial [Mycena sanguinolenta]